MFRKLPLLPFAIASLVYAHTDGTEHIHNMEDIKVTETVAVDTVSTISKEEIKKASSVRTVDGLLENIAGIDVARSGGMIKSKGISLRGFDESRYAVVLNGRLLNGNGVMGGDYVDWNSIPVDQIESVEIIRGSKTAQYGNALGGVIKITTKADIDEAETNARFTYGVTPDVKDKKILDQSFDAAFSHQDRVNEFFQYQINLGHFQNEGYLRNNHNKRTSVGGNVTITLPAGFELSGSAIITTTDRGYVITNDSTSSNYDPNYPISGEDGGGGPGMKWKGGDFYFGDRSHWENTRRQFDASLAKSFENLTVTLRGYLNDQDRTESYYAVTDTNHLVVERFAKPEDMTGGWALSAEQKLGTHALTYGVDGVRLRSTGTDIREVDSSYFGAIPTDSPNQKESIRQFGAFVQDNFTLLDDKLDINAGFRYDRFNGQSSDEWSVGTGSADKSEETIRNGFSPNGGVTAHLWEGGSVGVAAAMNYRMPNAPEFYWYFNGFEPEERKDLEPEQSMQIELSLGQKLLEERLSFTLRGYRYGVNDYIRWIFGYKPSHVIYNVDRVDFTGVEVEASYNLPKLLGFWGNYTYQTTEKSGDVLDISTGETNNLPELPEHKANAGIRFRTEKGVQADLVMRTVGMKKSIQGVVAEGGKFSIEEIDAFTTFGFNGSVPVVQSDDLTLNLRAGVENLFNAEYEEEFGFPMPGITFLAGFDAQF